MNLELCRDLTRAGGVLNCEAYTVHSGRLQYV